MAQLRNIKNKPLPYYNSGNTYREKEWAAALRDEFKALVARRLPGHHLNGLRQDYIVRFVAKYKHTYPYFLATDIAKFYPSVRHADLVTGFQVAYRDMLGLKFAPKAIKQRFLHPVNEWTTSLPLYRGIPLGSAMSAILAPLMLIPLWLHIKRKFSVPFIVYMDDVLILSRSQEECNRIYVYIENYLAHNHDLYLNANKTRSGRFASSTVQFCGWQFSGGYATIASDRVDAFKAGIVRELSACARTPLPGMIKRIDRKIDGFGNYYVHGNVARLYAQLDAFIRSQVRAAMAKRGDHRKKLHTNSGLALLGLHSLADKYTRLHNRDKKNRVYRIPKDIAPQVKSVARVATISEELLAQQLELMGKMQRQQTEMLRIQRQQFAWLKEVLAL